MNEDFLKRQEEIRKRNEERLAQFENRTERQKLAASAKVWLTSLVRDLYTRMNWYDLSPEELENRRFAIEREIHGLSDELALSIIKNVDLTLLRQSWHDYLSSLGKYNMYVPDGKYVKAVLDPEKMPKEPQIFEYIELSRVMEEAENSLSEMSPVEQAKQILERTPVQEIKVDESNLEKNAASSSRVMIADLTNNTILNEHKYDSDDVSINDIQMTTGREILGISDELSLCLIQVLDKNRMMEQRIIKNAMTVYDHAPYRVDHYSSLFTYLDKMAVKEAENVTKDSDIQNNSELATNLNSQQTSEDEGKIKQEETVDNSLNEALQKEKQARDAWRKNSSSYELYQNYKNSIAERLEIQKEDETSERSAIDDYEEKKQAYEEASVPKKSMEQIQTKTKEEIDTDLDDFEAEERRILNSKHYSEEQKKEMIERLYSEFDKYTEENPEISGRHL